MGKETQPTWYGFFNEACKKQRNTTLDIVNELIEIHKASNRSAVGYVDKLNTLHDLRKSYEAMPKNCDEMSEWMSTQNMIPLNCSHNAIDDIAVYRPFSQHELTKFIAWLDAKCTVAWSRKTALEQFANQTPLWNEYVGDTQSE